jgi:WD40 repeat protein
VADQDRAFRLVLVLLPGAPAPGDPGLGFMAGHPWVDLRSGAGDALAATDLVRALRGADVPAGLPAADGVSPYRGLEAFREEDAGLYFGREQDVARVLERLRTSRFVAIVGPSGSGKSSLAQAGVLPALRRDALAAGDAPRVLELVPGARPLAALAAQLGHLPGAGAPSPADLAADERALDLAVARALDGRPAEERVLILVDQLEEAFTLCADDGERAAFLGNLVYAATIPGGRAVVVITMRADFYHRLAEHPELRNLVAAQQVLLGPLDARNLRRAIEEPAHRCGLDLEPGLTRRILTDVADRPGTLPLLEHLLLEVWRRRRDRTLTLEGYAASGGVEGALARRANEVYGAMDPDRQAIARRVLLRLTQPGEGTEDTRRRATRSELVTDPAEQPEVDAVVEALAEARLVTTGTDDVTGDSVVEVTHEALIRGWPELRGWLDEDRDRLRAERRLSDAAAEWDRGGRDEGALYRGARLAAWGERDTSSLTPLEREFLAASTERAERDREARRKRVRIAIGALSVALAAIAAVAIFALVQRDDAADQRDIAQSRQIAATARDRIVANPEQSLLLAQDALATAPTAQAEESLRLATAASHVRFALDGHDGAVRALAPIGDGGRLASAGADGTIRLWDTADPAASPQVLEGHRGAVTSLAATPDGRILVSGGVDGTVRTWNSADGAQIAVVPASSREIRSVSASADGTRIAAVGADGRILTWTAGAATPDVLPGGGPGLRAVALDPQGRRVAVGQDVNVFLVDVRSGRRIRDFPGHTSRVSGVTFSPDGGRVLASSYDNTIYSWPVGGGKPVIHDSLGPPITSLALGAEGTQVIGGTLDASAIVWPSEGGPRIVTLIGDDAPVLAVAAVAGTPLIATGDENGSIRVYDPSSAEVPSLPFEYIPVNSRLTEDEAEIFGFDGARVRWDPESGDLERGPALPFPPMATALNDQGDVVRMFPGGRIVVRPADGRSVAPITGLPRDAYQSSLSADGTTFAALDVGSQLFAYDLSGAEPRRIVSARTDPLSAAVAAGNGGRVAASRGGTVLLWDRPGADPRTFEGAAAGVSSAAFSPDGALLAAGGRDGTVRVWDVADGTPLALLRNAGAVGDVTFSQDGRLLAAGATNETRIWDWRRAIAFDRWSTPGVQQVMLDPTATHVLTVGQTGVRYLTCDVCGSVDEVQALAEERVTRELSDEERREFGL